MQDFHDVCAAVCDVLHLNITKESLEEFLQNFGLACPYTGSKP
jgi:hypothetical protein